MMHRDSSCKSWEEQSFMGCARILVLAVSCWGTGGEFNKKAFLFPQSELSLTSYSKLLLVLLSFTPSGFLIWSSFGLFGYPGGAILAPHPFLKPCLMSCSRSLISSVPKRPNTVMACLYSWPLMLTVGERGRKVSQGTFRASGMLKVARCCKDSQHVRCFPTLESSSMDWLYPYFSQPIIANAEEKFIRRTPIWPQWNKFH